MRKVTAAELWSLADYEQKRDAYRSKMIQYKKARRVFLGPEMSLLFEDHETVFLQLMEMLRAERITAPEAIRHELETYNELVPVDGALSATLMIEILDKDVREVRRRDLMGLHDSMYLQLGSTRVPAVFAPGGIDGDRISVVQYLSFALPGEGAALLSSAKGAAKIVCAHPRYHYETELSNALLQLLMVDVSPEQAEKAAQS